MKYTNKQKTTRSTQSSQAHFQVPQSKGQALKPPASGINMVDNQTVQRMPAQQPALTTLAPENNTGLPDNLKTGIETLSGYAMDDVKVHYNSAKPAPLQAFAYTQGTDIHIAPGQERYLPHEAWHVVQQKQGRVHPTKQLKGKVNVNDDSALEREADLMGVKALRMSRSDQVVTSATPQTSPLHQYKRTASSFSDRGTQHSVYQLQTRIYYAPPNNRPGNSVINSTSHYRSLHNTTQRDLAAFHSGYANHAQGSAAGTGICNHHVSYAAIANAVLAKIHTNTPNQFLQEAVGWVNNTYNANLQGNRNFNNGAFGFTFGGFPAANIPNLGGLGPAQYDEFAVENEIDDIIFNLANDPQNLFYWPTSTGGDPDRPHAINNNSPLVGNNVTRAALRGRLNNYRNYLRNTLGLNVP